jgi:hypothetical protein
MNDLRNYQIAASNSLDAHISELAKGRGRMP